jgi:perosamine synthetase
MFGIPVDLPNTRNFKVVEDIAQALGAMASGEKIGLRGDVGICSFYATKLMTTAGQGGAVISRDKALIDKVRDYRQFDCREDAKLRFNFQMTDLHAAVGRVQLKKLPVFLEQRDQIFKIYSEAGLDFLGSADSSTRPTRYRAVMRCSKPSRMIEILKENGVGAIVPIERWELLDIPEKYPMAEQLTRLTLSLPIYPLLSVGDINKIATIAKKIA